MIERDPIRSKKYCENNLKAMPEEELLVAAEDEGAQSHHLTFIAEYIGMRCPEEKGFPALQKLLNNGSILVREGAIIGLGYYETPRVLEVFKQRLAVEDNQTVKEVLEDYIECLEEALSGK